MVASCQDGPQGSSPLGIHTLGYSPTMVTRADLVTIGYWGDDDVWLPTLGCNDTVASVVAVLSLSQVTGSWGEPSGEAYMARNRPLANSQGRDLGSGYSSPNQAFRWLQPSVTSWLQPHERRWAKATQLSDSLTPDPRKVCEVIHTCINLQSFTVICYPEIDSK